MSTALLVGPARGQSLVSAPKTYARVFELLLRLKANTLWPTMHPTTKAFNLYPRNRELADDYAIVMGSSHAEPMLRNNVSEWTAPAENYDFANNREGVLRYWEERVAENGRYENLYTIGMRGIHDSGMVGASSTEERIALLERIFADHAPSWRSTSTRTRPRCRRCSRPTRRCSRSTARG